MLVDRSEPCSLGAEIREILASSETQNAQKGPIIVSVNAAERVLLSGEELDTYWQLKEEETRRLEELEHRHLREKELTTLTTGGVGGEGMNMENEADTSDESGDSEDEDEENYEDKKEDYVPEEAGVVSSVSVSGKEINLRKKRKQIEKLQKKDAKKTKSIGRIAQYATPRFQMFETRELRQLPEYMDEYGLDNSDLMLTEIVTSTTLVPKQGKIHRTKEMQEAGSVALAEATKRAEEEALVEDEDVIDPTAPPSKVISKPTRVQLTCAFKETPPSAWGRLDLKGVKTLINKCSPKHLILLHGGNNLTHSSPSRDVKGLNHMKKVIEYATKSLGAMRVFAPAVNQAVQLQVTSSRILTFLILLCILAFISIFISTFIPSQSLFLSHHCLHIL